MPTTSVFDQLVDQHPAWWIDFLGEHNHVGGVTSTKWLFDHATPQPGQLLIDLGSFVGAAARYVATRSEAIVFAVDLAPEFLQAGSAMPGGDNVTWLAADSARLPFRDAFFDHVWCLDTFVDPREIARVAKPSATVALCSEIPGQREGGLEAYRAWWADQGFTLTAHTDITDRALRTWREAEADLHRRRPHYVERYGERGHRAHIDMLGDLVYAYDSGRQAHGLFILERGEQA